MAMTPEEKKAAKATREAARREQEAREVESARYKSLDACEAAVDERLEAQRHAVWHARWKRAEALRDFQRAGEKLAKAATESAAEAGQGARPFYSGDALARMAADFSAAQQQAEAACRFADAIAALLPGVTPIFADTEA